MPWIIINLAINAGVVVLFAAEAALGSMALDHVAAYMIAFTVSLAAFVISLDRRLR